MPQHGLLAGQTQQQYYNSGNYGGYQFISLSEVIDNFAATYTGKGKLLEKTNLPDINFHAHRALAELSFDTFKSCKSQEITVPASLTMILPQDYVNYTKISWVDSSGIKHRLYPTLCNTSNPTNPDQNSDGEFRFEVTAIFNSATAFLELDDAYPRIEPGDRVISPYIPSTQNTVCVVDSMATTLNTQIAVASDTNCNNPWTPSPALATVTVQIEKADGSLFKPASSLNYTATDIAITTGDYFVTVSTADADNIKVGMSVHGFAHGVIPPDTFVVAVNGTNITLSNAVGATTIIDINFIDQTFNSDTWESYSSTTPSGNQDNYQDDTYWPMAGERYGLDPQHAQANGSFFIDCNTGKIHFSSNISGKTVILDYISDSLGTDDEMMVHKFGEEAIYKWIAYGCLSALANVPQHVLARFKKEKFSETRKAKIRLSNIKLDEIAQILRGKSKHIKH